jgi:DDE superfamily endonuclease
MLIWPGPMVMVIGAFAPMVSKRIFAHVKMRVGGAILAPGKRPVTSVLRVMGSTQAPSFQNEHRVLNRAPWSTLPGGPMWLRLLWRAFVPSGPLVIGVEETIDRRRGEQIAAKGMYRDPVRSSRTHVVKARGWRRVSLLLLAPGPWTRRIWARPFLTVLSPSERSDQPRGRRPRTLRERARQAVGLVRPWLPARALVVVGDSTYAALEWLDSVRDAVGVITR